MSGRNAVGEGSVYQRKDGRWVAAAYVPVADGTYRRVSHYVRTKADAKAKLREMNDRAAKNMPAPPPSLTVEAYLGEWLTHMKQHVRRSTWVAYESNARLHIVPRIGRKKLSQLSVRDVRLMIDGLRKDGKGKRTVQYVHATLRAALEHAYREELVTRNVAKMVRVERPTPTPKEPLSVAEARRLLTATRDDEDHALWVVMLLLGLRRSEVCGLRWDNVDLENRTLSVTHSVQRVDGKLRELPTKTRRSTRTVPLPAMVHQALVTHRAAMMPTSQYLPEPVYVFGTKIGTPMEPRNLTRRWVTLAERQGIRRVPLHALRHSCVSLLLAQGVHPRTVMEIVGHSAIEMTMNVYGHVNLETQRRALDELDRTLR
ncbi:site-specific integrase [Nakamurella multipartita]|uniref:Integrase family protein n=1 Tax=Nakamurella multipartita (strain ATCC 700099 / DSM 44233 / CIP 104796 / JCM 9543 / NBRC 105858 / Y-104) TaxID=479431 RepID=C8X726_NAKMY|nr:site-specific integrase [Nakamurella multipartita]ACV76895.1 integrase family protein [Nakamurella multipartita DSM 44233]